MKLSVATVLRCAALVLSLSSPAMAQDPAIPKTIPEMWDAWCSRCHGKDGTGKVPEPTVTVEPMDFTDCSISTPEGDPDWEAVISKGGPIVGLSSQMPAFGDFLTPAQVSEFVGFIKKFCTERGWPSGNLNLPRPMFTEKAFLENEFILAPVASHRQGESKEYELAAIYERRTRQARADRSHPSDRFPRRGVRTQHRHRRHRAGVQVRAESDDVEPSRLRGH